MEGVGAQWASDLKRDPCQAKHVLILSSPAALPSLPEPPTRSRKSKSAKARARQAAAEQAALQEQQQQQLQLRQQQEQQQRELAVSRRKGRPEGFSLTPEDAAVLRDVRQTFDGEKTYSTTGCVTVQAQLQGVCSSSHSKCFKRGEATGSCPAEPERETLQPV